MELKSKLGNRRKRLKIGSGGNVSWGKGSICLGERLEANLEGSVELQEDLSPPPVSSFWFVGVGIAASWE
ncbi:hypothetical protein SUGI_0929770 [Cryptomeria japonica]|nr:hypothetical protein SUGI_0929770 [Cryptomeria japonica]